MPGLIAEAFVRIRPDFTQFRRELQTGLNAALAGANVGAATAATASLTVAKEAATGATLGLASAAQVENSAFGRQAVILKATTAATLQAAGAQETLTQATNRGTAALLGAGSASARLDAALLGIRTAVGSAAVIGLGALALSAIAAGKAVRAIITDTSAFEEELNVLQATARATDEEMRRVGQVARELGADVTLPAVSAADAAEAMSGLVRAGLSLEEAMAGAEGVLQLATAAQITNAEASQLAANALNSFGLAGTDAVRVADALANAANAAQGSISDFGQALAQVAAIARQVGFSLEETTSILSILAQEGLRGSDAGTSLRTALLRLVAPTAQANDLIRSLGLTIRDAQGNVRPEVFLEFGEATAALGPEVRDAAAALIFGQDAIRAVGVLSRQTEGDLRAMNFEIDRQGAAAELAAARTRGLGGAASGLSSTAETLGINLGRLASPILTGLVEGFADLVGTVNLAVEAFEKLGDVDLGPLEGDQSLLDILGLEADTSGLDLIRSGLERLGIGSQDTARQVEALQEELNGLQEARVEAERGGLSGVADALTEQIKNIRDEIRAVREEAGEIIPVTQTERTISRLQTALENLGNVRQSFLERDLDTSALDEQIIAISRRVSGLASGIIDATADATRISIQQLRASLETALQVFEADPTGPLAEKTLTSIRNLITRIRNEGGALSASAGADIGRRLMDAMGTSITQEEAGVIAAARRALGQAIRAGQEQVSRAVQAARDNLDTLGASLSRQLEEIIDVGPIGRRLGELEDELDRFQERVSRRQIRFDLSQAEIDLREAREAVAQIGVLTPRQQRARREFLAPFVEGVADARAELREFNLEEAIEKQEELKDSAVEAATEGLERLIGQFEAGELSAGDFNRLLTRQLSPALDILKSKAGQNLGLSFTSDFFQNVRNLRDQVRELVGFLNVPDTSGVVRPGETQAEAQARVAEARGRVDDAIRSATQATAENSDEMVELLEEIRDALAGRGIVSTKKRPVVPERTTVRGGN